jgi:hypothetical protein
MTTHSAGLATMLLTEEQNSFLKELINEGARLAAVQLTEMTEQYFYLQVPSLEAVGLGELADVRAKVSDGVVVGLEYSGHLSGRSFLRMSRYKTPANSLRSSPRTRCRTAASLQMTDARHLPKLEMCS